MKFSWKKRAREFEQTALPYLGDLFHVARQMSDEHRAQDLVQETYLRAWKYFETFEHGTNCRAWLFRILHNVWMDAWRHTQREIPLTEKEEALIEPYYDWEDEFIKDELSENVEQALSQLPAMYRWAVLLADVEELSYQEMAQVMNCPVGTVMSRLNRGRRTLAGILRADAEKRADEVNRISNKSLKEK